ncbi:amidohydrolase [alpha proteobacterium U9-1i]|nr:amidohydrolase [alpha proteobacterium U9-1i]
MGFWNTGAAAACALVLSGCATGATDEAATVFRDVSVLTMTSETVLEHQSIIVRDGLIAAIGPTATTPSPAGARVIDGAGRYVMPGLVDAHAHPTAQSELISYALYGVTSLFTLGGEGINDARPAPGLFAPNVLSSGTTFDSTPPINRRFLSLARPEDAGALIDQQLARGAAFVKVYTFLDQPRLCAIYREAHARNIAVVGHIPRALSADEALACLDMVAHGEEFFRYMGRPPTPEGIAAMADAAARHGVFVTPNISAYAGMYRHVTTLDQELADPEAAFLSPPTYQEVQPQNNRYASRPNRDQFRANTVQGMTTLKAFTAALHARGVPLLAGTDAPIMCFPGRCLLQDLDLLREAGLSHYEILRTATSNAGRFVTERMHRNERIGVVEVGARADLIMLSANPLESLDALEDVRGVMIAGVYRTRAEIVGEREALRPAIARAHAQVDEYERLLAAGDMAALTRFIDAQPVDVMFLNMNVVIFDALTLEQEGKRVEALALLTSALRHLPRAHGMWNELGRMRAEGGDVVGARAAYQSVLAFEPLNGVAQAGLAALTPPP